MKKLRESLTNRKFVASFISVSILTLLFLAGPVQAFILGLGVMGDSEVEVGKNITFIASLGIQHMDKYLPVHNFTLIISGPTGSTPLSLAEICVFDINGNKLSECKGIVSIERISDHSGNKYGYGYGYGYDSENGYGYDFGYSYGYDYGYSYGYDYGYGYNNGYGGKQLNFTYRIILDTTNYSEGTYDTFLRALIGEETFSKEGTQITINAPSTPLEEKEEKKIKTSSRRTSTFYYNPFNTTSNQTSQGNNNGDGNGNETILRLEGDEVPRDNQNFFSAITGAVIGTLGPTGTIFTGLFIVAILGGVGLVSYRKRKLK